MIRASGRAGAAQVERRGFGQRRPRAVRPRARRPPHCALDHRQRASPPDPITEVDHFSRARSGSILESAEDSRPFHHPLSTLERLHATSTTGLGVVRSSWSRTIGGAVTSIATRGRSAAVRCFARRSVRSRPRDSGDRPTIRIVRVGQRWARTYSVSMRKRHGMAFSMSSLSNASKVGCRSCFERSRHSAITGVVLDACAEPPKLTTAARRLEAQTRQQLERVRADELATQGRMRALVAARARMVSRDGDLTVREMARLVQDAATLDLRETREELESQVLMAIEALEMDADEDLAATCDGAKGRLDRAARKAARHSSGRGGHVEGVCQTLLAELAILEEATAGRQETAGRKALPRIPPPSFPRLQVEVNFEASDGVVASVIDSFHWTWPFFGSRARENFRDALEEARRMIMASAQRHGRQAREKQVAEVVAYLTSRRGQVLLDMWRRPPARTGVGRS